jgi:hypothetical protein
MNPPFSLILYEKSIWAIPVRKTGIMARCYTGLYTNHRDSPLFQPL